MPAWTLPELSKKMREIDFAMLSTRAPDGAIAARPMSNNGEVEYDGDNYLFTTDDSQMVSDIEGDPRVSLSFQGKSGIFGMRPLFIAIEGEASLIRDKARFTGHWTTDLDRWFKQGVDTPGLVLIKVQGRRAHYWNGEDEGELILQGAGTLV